VNLDKAKGVIKRVDERFKKELDIGHPLREVRDLFPQVGEFQNGGFVPRSSYNLPAHGEFVFGKPYRNADGGNGCQVHRNGEDVGEIHINRVLELFAELKGGRGGGGGEDYVYLLEGVDKILVEQSLYLLRLQIVGVVVAG